MDIRTGKTYDTELAAVADGVPRSDIAHVHELEGRPVVKFSKGSFKNYTRNERGELMLVKP